VPRPKPFPLQPAIEPAKDERQEEPKPKPQDTAGDMAKAKPITDGVNLGTGEEQRKQRPRTLQEAMARNQLAGQKTKMDGAAKIRGQVSINAKVTPFSSYDAAFVAAVQQRWYDLLDSSQFSQRSGRVVLEFKLTYDGRITDLKASDNEVGEILALLCQRAILDPAPYARWPDDMRRMIGSNHREVTFTFYYN
jgi:outer membrane biosynthesis protein TonB